MHIVAISGSLRKGSFNTALLREFAKLAPEDMQIEIADIGSLPLYNSDDEAAFPAEAQAFKNKIKAADGVIIATPEYNRSIPGVLKNAIDWASRPYGQNSFAKKPVLVAGVSVGKIGTAVAQSHLRQIMVYLDTVLVGQPEIYVGPVQGIFDEKGNMTDDSTKALLANALSALAGRVR
ncbi:MAG: NAD(P)H-dependent oxidoreductase [Candidatus Paceibacterota bacterium]|jgi:chromate reductase